MLKPAVVPGEDAGTIGLEDRASDGVGLLNWLDMRSAAELADLYRNAPESVSLEPLDYAGLCRGMSLVGFRRGFLAQWLRRRARSARFIWRGKRFKSVDAQLGYGINELLFVRRFRALRFQARIAQSIVDGRQCIAIDYNYTDNKNPWFQRPMYDELREVRDGLYMGPVTYRFPFGRRRVLCYFAVHVEMPRTEGAD
ncbi:hypothetical protein [Litorivivens sp.]|uniref:hypothetical protein n=1 Tax=Litorivivens sp. TaxID=2020868 RepID=UPI00356259F3